MSEKRLAVVTGGMGGLGESITTKMADAGYRVVVTYSPSNTKWKSWLENMKQQGYGFSAYPVDVADFDDSELKCAQMAKECGPIDILVNNAGITRDMTFKKMSKADWDAVMRTNLDSCFNMTKQVMDGMSDRGWGRVINVSSVNGQKGAFGQTNYSAAKAGIVSLTMGAAQLLLKYGVTANVFVPRARTRMTDTGPVAAMFAKPEEGFDAFAPENTSPLIGYLASPRAGRVSGHVFVVWNREVKVVSRPGYEEIFESDAQWNTDSLHDALGPFFEKREPVTDGYTVPAM